MFKKSLLLTLLMAFLVPLAMMGQETLTVCDGTTTNGKIPVNGLYVDTQGTTSEFIIPADSLEGMANGTISKLTFYVPTPPATWGNPTIQLYMGEVDYTTLSSLNGPTNFTVVSTGTWDNTQSTIEVEFDTPYTYEGGNLLIGTYIQTKSSTYKTTNFAGVSATSGASRYNNGSGSGTAASFLPKTTFTYTAGSAPTCAKPSDLTVSDVLAHQASFSWTENGEATTWRLCFDDDEENTIEVTNNPTATLDGFDPETTYSVKVKSYCGNGEWSAWSSKVNFTTEPSCYVPTGLAVTNVAAYTATISWTDELNSGADTWQICFNNDETDLTTTHVTTNPFGGLTPETTYNVKVRTVCGENDYSQWTSNVSFTTAEVCPDGMVCIGTGTATTNSVPANNYYKYSLSEQIYTAAEIGEAGAILSIDFYKASNEGMMRTLDIYMVSTTKDEFTSKTDWITVTASDLVYSGSVTFTNNDWTTIELDNPFIYDGTNNVCIVVDDNTGSYLSETPFRTFTAAKDQTIYQQNDNTNLDPTAASIGTATGKMSSKNRIRLAIGEPPACAKPTGLIVNNIAAHEADLTWTENGEATAWIVEFDTDSNFTNVLVENVSGEPNLHFQGLAPETTYYVRVKAQCAPGNESDYSSTSFTTTIACPAPTVAVGSITAFTAEVSCTNTAAENFNVMLGEEVVAENVSMPYTLTELTDNTSYTVKVQAICGGEDGESAYSDGTTFMTAEICPDGMVCIGTGTATNSYLPAYNYYNYSYTQQIYTADEIGMDGQISSIEFKNTGAEKTFTLNIYMTNTTKTAFESTSDWVAMSESDLVFSGEVTFAVGEWTTIELDNPFVYDGTSNLLVTVANVTGSYSNSPHIACLTFPATDQALYAYQDASAYNITAPGVSGTKPAFKNRIRIAIGEPPACAKPTQLAVNYEGGITATVTWEGTATSYNIDVNGTVTEGVTSPYALEGLELANTYTVMVQTDCGSNGTSEWTSPISFTTDLCLPENMCQIGIELTDAYGDGGGQIQVVDALTDEVLGTYTNSGASTSYTLAVCDGRELNFVYTNTDSYAYENGFVFTDVNGEVIAEHVGCSSSGCTPPTNGVVATYTVDCFPCAKPTNLAAEIQNYTSAHLTWNGTNDSYNLRYREVVFMDNFENGFAKWNVIDADGDGYGFVLGSESGGIYHNVGVDMTGQGHNGSNDMILSASYSNNLYNETGNGALYPDNYMISPKLELGQTFSFWAQAQDASYPAEHFGVAVSTESNNNPDDFTTIAEWTLTAKGTSAKANPGTTRSGNRGQGTWYQYTVDLSAYAGQEGYIAIRHFDCSDQFILNLDDVTYGPAADEGWTFVEGLASMEYLLENLNEHTDYEFQLQGVCGTTEPKLSDWTSSAYFSTLADEPQAVLDGGAWNNPDTWVNSGNQVPEPEQAVTVLGDVVVTENLEVTGEITIADGATLTVEEGVVFNAGEINVTSPDQLIIGSGAQFMHTGEVPATVNLTYLASNAKDSEYGLYRLIASPINPYVTVNATGLVPDISDTLVDLYYFDQSSQVGTWINYKQADNHFVTLNIKKGYLYSNYQNANAVLAGLTIPTNTDTDVNLDYTDGTMFAGWNLVGNPFTCSCYITDGTAAMPYYVLNAEATEVSATQMTTALAPMAGAFVQATAAGQKAYFTTTQPSRGASLDITVNQGRGMVDNAFINFGGVNTLEKFQLNPNHTKIYFPQEGKDYAVVTADNQGEMPVNFKAEENGNYTISFNAQDVEFSYLHLIDNLTGNDVDLLENPSYSFDARTTDYASRFKLVFATGNTNSSECNFGFISDGNLMILGIEGEATLQIIDVTGRILSTETFSGSYSKAINEATGVYMLRLIQGSNVRTQKIVIK